MSLRSHAAEVISVRFNDKAARALGFPFDAVDLAGVDPGELGRRLTAGGLARDERGGLFVPALSFNVPDFPDLTYRECQRNSWHLHDHPDVHVEVDEDGAPHVTYEDQVHMLKQGIVLSHIVRDLPMPFRTGRQPAASPGPTTPTERSVSISYAPGERWINDDLDGYLEDMIIVIENQPQLDKLDSTE